MTWQIKAIAIAVAIGALIAMGLKLLDDAEARGRRAGRAEVVIEQLEPLQAAYDSARNVWLQEDSVKAQEIRQLQDDQVAMEELLVRARGEANAGVALLDSAKTAADSLTAAIAALEMRSEEAIQCSLALRNCATLTATLEGRVAGLERQDSESQGLITQQRNAIEELQNLPMPNTTLPWLVAGGMAVLAVLALVF